jgi:hypothetical protein
MEVPSFVHAVNWKADGRGGKVAIPSFSIRHMNPLASLAVSWVGGGRGGEGGGIAIPSLSSSQRITWFR